MLWSIPSGILVSLDPEMEVKWAWILLKRRNLYAVARITEPFLDFRLSHERG